LPSEIIRVNKSWRSKIIY